jgi:hypothetical protein
MAGVPSLGEPDVMRIARFLPGVMARNDYSTGLNVNGGEADQNLVLLDGVQIYNPFHLGGLFSTFADATVGGIELMTAAFPARYGGRLSSVLDVKSAEEMRPGLHGSANISVIAATARLASTFGGGLGTWSVSGRRTYIDAFAKAFTTNSVPYHFSDVHAHATYDLPSNVRLALTAYTGRDNLDDDFAKVDSDSTTAKASEGGFGFKWGNQVVGLSLSKQVGSGATIEQRLSSSGFSTLLDVGNGTFAQRSEIRDVSLAGSLFAPGVTHDRSIGYELSAHRLRYSSGSSQTGTNEFDVVQRPLSGSLWVDDLWRLSSRWLVEGGLRAEALSGRNWAALSPRLSVKYFARPDFALTAGAGRVTQWQHSLAGDGPLRFFDIWVASDSLIPTAAAWHWVAGAERRLRDVGSVRVEGYFKRYDRVLDVNPQDDPAIHGDEFLATQGLSYGLDVHARWQPASGLAGWLSYSYGLSSRWRGTERWAPGHDRRHDFNVVATWKLAKYDLGARFGYATGTPYTPIIGGITRRIYDPSRDRWGTGDPDIFTESLGGTRNSERYPAVQRLDLDASRTFQRRGVTFAPYISVVNAYNAKNVFVYIYKYTTDRPTRRALSQFPILPSAGLRVAF